MTDLGTCVVARHVSMRGVLALRAHANQRLDHAHMLMGITALCSQQDGVCHTGMHNSVKQACTNMSYTVACSALS